MRFKFITFPFLLIYCLVLVDTAFAMEAKEIYKRVNDSIVTIISCDLNSKPISYGTGFFILDGKSIVTNLHVVKKAAIVIAKMQAGKEVIIENASNLDNEKDIIILQSSIKGPPLRFSSEKPEIGEEILAIGNPQGLEKTLSTGVISGIRNTQSGYYYQITAPISPGSSGGPVLNAKGEVLGISTFFIKEGQNLNFAVPSEYIVSLTALQRLIKFPLNLEQKYFVQDKQEKAEEIIVGKLHWGMTIDEIKIAYPDFKELEPKEYSFAPNRLTVGDILYYAFGIKFSAFLKVDKSSYTLQEIELSIMNTSDDKNSDECSHARLVFDTLLESMIKKYGSAKVEREEYQKSTTTKANWFLKGMTIFLQYSDARDYEIKHLKRKNNTQTVNCWLKIVYTSNYLNNKNEL